MDAPPTLEAALHILAASAAGALIGWESEAHDSAAGLRTHSLPPPNRHWLARLMSGLRTGRAVASFALNRQGG